MDEKERHDFFKDLYDKEFTRKEAIENSVNIPISITTALIVLLYFIISEYDKSCSPALVNITFFGLSILTGLFTLVGIVYLIKMYVNIYHKKYKAIPYADQLDTYRQTLQTYYNTNAASLSHTTAQALFVNYLTEHYINQTASNTRVNDTKLKEIETTKRALSVALLVSILSLIPFFYNFFTKPEKTYFIEAKKPLLYSPVPPTHGQQQSAASPATTSPSPRARNYRDTCH